MKTIKTPKDKILISFSGGETSGFMINWLLNNMPNNEYRCVFANTGEENEETLEFVQKCSEFFNIPITWVEYERLGYKEVDYHTAYRSHDPVELANGWKNHPFRNYISEFGIPNEQNMTCSRELKERIIRRYMSSDIGWKPSTYDIAIGIRADEVNRIGQFYYPLLQINCTKEMVNAFWSKMPFRLELKGWEGNCKVCWKKSFRKLVTIARHHPERFAFFKQMEEEYGDYLKPGREQQRERIIFPIHFFRVNKSVDDIFLISKDLSIEDAHDDTLNTNYQTSLWNDGTELDVINGCVESCDAFN